MEFHKIGSNEKIPNYSLNKDVKLTDLIQIWDMNE